MARARLKDPQIGPFCAALRDQGYVEPVALVERARPLLQIPDALVGLVPIVNNVESILPSVGQLLPEPARLAPIHAFVDAVKRIPRNHPLWDTAPYLTMAIWTPERMIRSPLKNHMTSHPVWCALWYIHHERGSVDDQAYRFLQAQFFASHLRLTTEPRVDRSSVSEYDASRFVRTVHQREAGWLFDYFRDADSPKRLISALYQIQLDCKRAKDDAARYAPTAAALAKMITVGHDFPLETRDPGVGLGRRSGGRRRPQQIYGDRIGPDHSGYWYYTSRHLLLSTWGTDEFFVHGHLPEPEIQDQLEEGGLVAAEYEALENADVSVSAIVGGDEDEEVIPTEDLPPLPTLYARARGAARRIALDAQRLRIDPRRARLSDLGAVLAVLASVFKDTHGALAARPHHRTLKSETALLGAIALVTGLNPSESKSVLCINRVADLSPSYVLAYNPTHRMWIRPYQPPPRHPLEAEYRAYTQSTWPRIVFEDLLGIGRHLERMRDPRHRNVIFRRKLTTYKRCWDSEFAPRLAKLGVERRWRAFKNLHLALPSWFAWFNEGEHLSAMLLFATQDHLAQTQHYYTALQRNELAEHYRTHLQTIIQAHRLDNHAIGDAPNTLYHCHWPATRIDQNWVGNDRIPRAEVITTLVGAVRAKLTTSATRPKTATCWFERHNLLTVYTALGLAMATGARAIRTPFPDLTAVHGRTGTVALQEKDRVDESHARLVVLPGVVLAQTRDYLQHLIALFAAHPALPMTLECRATKMRDRSAYDSSTFEIDLRRTLFFLDSEYPNDPASWLPEELTGSTLQTHCNRISVGSWPVANAGRHFLRSYLIQEGCAATLVNAHLGHWHYGEEPWAGPSAFDPVRYRQGILPYLNRLMDAIGYIRVTR